jgi:hypothetical protein
VNVPQEDGLDIENLPAAISARIARNKKLFHCLDLIRSPAGRKFTHSAIATGVVPTASKSRPFG